MKQTLEQILAYVRAAGARGQSLDEAIGGLGLDRDGITVELGIRRSALFHKITAAHEEGCRDRRAETWIVRYTTAELNYDWMGTEDLGIAGFDARSLRLWRKVRIAPKQVEGQVARYLSGTHASVDQEGFDRFLECGLVVKE